MWHVCSESLCRCIQSQYVRTRSRRIPKVCVSAWIISKLCTWHWHWSHKFTAHYEFTARYEFTVRYAHDTYIDRMNSQYTMNSQYVMHMTLILIASLQKSLQCLPRARASNRDICTDWVRLYHEVLYDTLSYKTSWCTLQKYCSIHSPKVLYGTVSYSTLCYTLTLHCMAQSHIVLWYCLIQYFMIHSQKVLYDTVSKSDVWYSLTKYCMV